MANEMTGKWAGAQFTMPVGGGATTVSTLGKWNVSQSFNPIKFAASNTKGAKAVRGGIVDWSGSIERFAGYPLLNGASAPVMPGDIFEFNGYVGPASGVPGTVGPALAGRGIVDSLSVSWDWSANGLLKQVYTISCVRPLQVFTGAAAVVDTSTSQAAPSAGTKIQFALPGAEGVFFDLCAQKATLNIMCENQSFANSCSVGTGVETPLAYPVGLAYQTRKPGNIDWNMTVTLDNSNPNTLGFTPGTCILLRAYIDGSTYWVLKWGFVTGFSNFQCDRETGAIVTYDMQIEGSADDGTIGATTDGQIVIPGGGSPWWPL